MDLHHQMLLAAWLRPPVPLPIAPNSSNSNSSPSSSSSIPPSSSLANLRHIFVHPSAQNQQQLGTAPVIRRVASSSQLGVFDPSQLPNPALASVDPCFFGPAPPPLDPHPFCPPPLPPQFNSISASPMTPPPPHLDHLMALAVHKMLERLRAAEMAQKQQIGGEGQQQPPNPPPPIDHSSLSNHPFGLPPSAFSAVLPSPTPEMAKIVAKSASGHSRPEDSMEKTIKNEAKSSEHSQRPINGTNAPGLILPHQFVPSPSTSADELLEEALGRLVQKWDGGKAAENGDQKGTTNLGAGGGNAAQGVGQEGPSNGSNGIPSDGPNGGGLMVGEEVLLCKVCSDKASGFHYGIFSCEGCKGFFRRSLQNKIDYRPCTQSQKCQIVRANRNRCQECRWRKCIEAGMSKDGVRYGRVPKREKEKMREEMRRDSVRTLLEQLALDLGEEGGNGQMMVERLERGWAELATEIGAFLAKSDEEEEKEGLDGLVDASRLCALAEAVVRFSGRLAGFRLIRREDRVQLIKESLYPILLLLLSSPNAKGFPTADDGQENSLSASKLCQALLLPPSSPTQSPHQNRQLLDCSLEFVHRLKEAKPPVEVALSDRQLAICAAICLCRLDGGGECAAGGSSAASASACVWEEQSGQLGQLVCRRVRDRLLQLLNASLGAFGPERPSPVVCQFGPALLRTDLLIRQNLAAVFERLKHCRDLHRQFLLASNCWNIPLELFAIQNGPKSNPVKMEMPILGQNGEARKRRAGEEGNEKECGGAEEKPKIQQKGDKNGNKSHKQADLLPTLRRALEQPSAIVIGQKGNQPPNGGKQSSLLSLKERHREMTELLERPPLIPPMELAADEELPLNLCIRDGHS